MQLNISNVPKSNVKKRPIDPAAIEAGIRLRRVREHLGLTGQELADATGVSKAAISYVENGRYWPDGKLLHYLAEKYSVREAYVLRGELPVLGDASQGSPLEIGDSIAFNDEALDANEYARVIQKEKGDSERNKERLVRKR